MEGARAYRPTRSEGGGVCWKGRGTQNGGGEMHPDGNNGCRERTPTAGMDPGGIMVLK